VTTTAAVAGVPAGRRGGAVLLVALLVAAVGLRPQLVGVGPLLPDIEEDLGVSHAVAGAMATIPVLCMGLFAPFAGRLGGRHGVRLAIAGCLAVIAAAGLGRAGAPGAAVLLALTLPIGIAMALAGALLPVAVKLRFSHRPAFASGMCTTGINLGAAVSSALAVPAAAAFGGWRGALAAFSLVTVGLCASWLWLTRGAWGERAAADAQAPRLPVRRFIVWVVVLVFGLQSLVYYGLVAWIADAYQERGWSDGAAGSVLAVMGLAAIPSGLLVSWLADRMGDRREWMAGGACCLAVGTFGFAAIPGGAYGWAVLVGGAMGALFPLCLAMCLDVAREPAEAGAAAALMFLAGYPIAALAPLGLGAVRDATGSHATGLWIEFAVAAVLVLCCLALSPRRLRPRADALGGAD
jgi:CP family cyanate transporter-like MFS transporter